MSTNAVYNEARPGNSPAVIVEKESWGEWLDKRSGTIFIAPAVILILIFAIFPTIASLVIAVSRVKLTTGGFAFRFVWFKNFSKQFFGNDQVHLLGRFTEMSVVGMVISLMVSLWAVWWLVKSAKNGSSVMGLVGRLITALLSVGVIFMLAGTAFSGNPWGTLGTTLFYVFVGCGVQFVIGLGLALLCSQQIRGRSFFRVVFFIPLMITPLGVGYAFRMIADVTKGPFAPVWAWFGLGSFAWSADPWAARFFVIIGDSWQWIPFIFIVMLAALENVPRDHVEAAQVDGASGWQIFREITWPQIIPVAATVILIRAIEAFKIVDLPLIHFGKQTSKQLNIHKLYTDSRKIFLEKWQK